MKAASVFRAKEWQHHVAEQQVSNADSTGPSLPLSFYLSGAQMYTDILVSLSTLWEIKQKAHECLLGSCPLAASQVRICFFGVFRWPRAVAPSLASLLGLQKVRFSQRKMCCSQRCTESHLPYVDLFFFSFAGQLVHFLSAVSQRRQRHLFFFFFLSVSCKLLEITLFCLEVTKNCCINFKSVVE